MREKLLEKNFCKGVKKRKGYAFKFTSPGTDGVPDRLACFPVNRFFFAELKSTGKKLRPTQRVVKQMLAVIGIPVYVIDTEEDLINFFKDVDYDL